MGFRKDRPTLSELRELDIKSYLATLGHKPVKVRGYNHWYLSPLRDERTASFKVNARLNRWYDFGLGKGGSILDFCMLYFVIDLNGAAATLSGLSFPSRVSYDRSKAIDDGASQIVVSADFEISSPALTGYFTMRGISVDNAARFCREIGYRNGAKHYYGVGFRNNLGGWEIRSQYFKGSASPKGIKTILDGHETICVFEGLFDFLTYREIALRLQLPPTDFLILNSLSFAGGVSEFLGCYEKVLLFLDNDKAGKNVSQSLLGNRATYKDMSYLYTSASDLNEFWTLSSCDTSVFDVLKDIPP